MTTFRPAWLEPMLWLVIGLPLAAIIASLLLVVQAVHGGPDDAVIDPVQRTAQMQVRDATPERQASRLGLSLTLLATAQNLQLVPVTGSIDRTTPLQLTLAHPADDDHDIHLTLLPSPQGWSGPPIDVNANDWIVSLTAADGSWRLQGRLVRGQQALLLRSAAP